MKARLIPILLLPIFLVLSIPTGAQSSGSSLELDPTQSLPFMVGEPTGSFYWTHSSGAPPSIGGVFPDEEGLLYSSIGAPLRSGLPSEQFVTGALTLMPDSDMVEHRIEVDYEGGEGFNGGALAPGFLMQSSTRSLDGTREAVALAYVSRAEVLVLNPISGQPQPVHTPGQGADEYVFTTDIGREEVTLSVNGTEVFVFDALPSSGIAPGITAFTVGEIFDGSQTNVLFRIHAMSMAVDPGTIVPTEGASFGALKAEFQ